MGGSDLCNSLVQRLMFPQKSHRWWVPIYQWGVHVAATNAYIFWHTFPWPDELKHFHKWDHLKFRTELIRTLIGDYCNRKRPGRPPGR